jgi:hypothetical protein
MTEAEWMACTDTTPMLKFLRGKASGRKVRLFAVACCHRVWALLQDEKFRGAVGTAELFADGMATSEEMSQARDTALAAFVSLPAGQDEAPAACISAAGIPAPDKPFLHQLLDALFDPWWEDEFDKGDPQAPAVVTARHAAWAAAQARGQRPDRGSVYEMAEQRGQASILRDIFGNPFRPSPPLPPAVLAWNAGTVRRIAEGIYQERQLPAGTLDNARLGVLADALLDAGSDDDDLIRHCRSEGPHYRGCWAVDRVLGRE